MDEKQLLKLIGAIAISITVVWVGAVGIAPLVWHDFHPPIELTAVMTTSITGLLGLYLKAKNPKDGPKNGGGNDV